MQVPELYRYGREQRFFGLVRFGWYMIDGIYQVRPSLLFSENFIDESAQSAIVFFFILYAYKVTTTRQDGWDPALYEFSTVMALSAVYAANLYNGLNTHSWTVWVWVSVFLGPLLIFLYTVIYSAIKPGWIWTFVFGNNVSCSFLMSTRISPTLPGLSAQLCHILVQLAIHPRPGSCASLHCPLLQRALLPYRLRHP